MKKGLILEGGAMRGLFTAGVLDAFLKHKVKFDAMVGVSAGAAFGCNFKSKQIGRVIRYNTKFCRDKRYCSLKSLIKTGDLYNAQFCYHELPEKHDVFDTQTFLQNPMDFFVVCTELTTGEPVYKKLDTLGYEDLEWIRASASMPVVSNVVRIGDYQLLDGGIADAIPCRFFENKGYRNVVVLTRPENYRKKQARLMPLLKMLYRKYPEFAHTFEKRYAAYNDTLEHIREQEKKGELFVIRPPHALKIGKTEHNSEKMRQVYETGLFTGEILYPALREYLG